jgi:hypothetical protein
MNKRFSKNKILVAILKVTDYESRIRSRIRIGIRIRQSEVWIQIRIRIPNTGSSFSPT